MTEASIVRAQLVTVAMGKLAKTWTSVSISHVITKGELNVLIQLVVTSVHVSLDMKAMRLLPKAVLILMSVLTLPVVPILTLSVTMVMDASGVVAKKVSKETLITVKIRMSVF